MISPLRKIFGCCLVYYITKRAGFQIARPDARGLSVLQEIPAPGRNLALTFCAAGDISLLPTSFTLRYHSTTHRIHPTAHLNGHVPTPHAQTPFPKSSQMPAKTTKYGPKNRPKCPYSPSTNRQRPYSN